MIVDDSGDAILLIHKSFKAERAYEKKGALHDLDSTDIAESKIVSKTICDELLKNPKRWHGLADKILGVSEETTTGVHRLIERAEEESLSFSAMNVINGATKSILAVCMAAAILCRMLLWGATDVMLGGRSVLICGYGDAGEECALAKKAAGASCIIAEIHPICELPATMEGVQVTTLNVITSAADIVITAAGNENIGSGVRKAEENAVLRDVDESAAIRDVDDNFAKKVNEEMLQKAELRTNPPVRAIERTRL